jgi:hypothetical protein
MSSSAAAAAAAGPSSSNGNKRKLSEATFRSPGFKLTEQYRCEATGLDTTISLQSDDFDLRGWL